MKEAEHHGDELTLKLLIVLSRANRSIMEYSQRELQRFGLNLTEFAVLELLFNKGPHTLQQIREKVLIASSSITYVIDQLEKKGYLCRRSDEFDRRVTYAHLIEQGQRFMEDVFPKHVALTHEVMDVLTPDEQKTAIELLKKLGIHARSKLS